MRHEVLALGRGRHAHPDNEFAAFCGARRHRGTWATWAKQADPVSEGQFIASDPTLVRDGDQYRMFYTCFSRDLTKDQGIRSGNDPRRDL
jgi:hypothetical protein